MYAFDRYEVRQTRLAFIDILHIILLSYLSAVAFQSKGFFFFLRNYLFSISFLCFVMYSNFECNKSADISSLLS